jgi:hypothetical protein
MLLDNYCDGCSGGATNGVQVIQYPANGLATQKWTLHSQGSGYFTMVSVQSGMCLDDPWGNGDSLAHTSSIARDQYYALAAALQWECGSKLEVHSAEQRLLRCSKSGSNHQQWVFDGDRRLQRSSDAGTSDVARYSKWAGAAELEPEHSIDELNPLASAPQQLVVVRRQQMSMTADRRTRVPRLARTSKPCS